LVAHSEQLSAHLWQVLPEVPAVHLVQAVAEVHSRQLSGHLVHVAVPFPKYPFLQVAHLVASVIHSSQLSGQLEHLLSLIPLPEALVHLVQVSAAVQVSHEESLHAVHLSVSKKNPLLQFPLSHLPAPLVSHPVQLASHFSHLAETSLYPELHVVQVSLSEHTLQLSEQAEQVIAVASN